jgi:hypothetical protein
VVPLFASREPASVRVRDLVLVLAWTAIGALGALPGSRGRPDPIAFLAWLSLCSLPAGVIVGGSGAALWPIGPAVPAAWMAILGLVAASSTRVLPTPTWAALAWTGLFALGFALGRAQPDRRWRNCALVFIACAVLDALAISGAWLASPLAPPISARTLDLAPATLLAECAGIDWMRHPAIYEPAGAIDIDPGLRVAWRGALAGPIVLLVGCAAALAAERCVRRSRRSPG